jgi:hypothetical protein
MLRSIPRTLRAGTADVPVVPPWMQAWCILFLGPILAWAETRIYRAVLTRCADHPLVQVGTRYDPAAVVAACAGFHAEVGGPGAPITFTIEQLVRAEIVRVWAESCADRDLEWHLATNLVVRWFVGISLFAPQIPDHTTLERFHVWMRQHAPDAWFRDVLRFLDQVDPEDPATTPQIVDTFGMAAPVAWPPRTANLLLDLCDDLIRHWEAHAPRAAQRALPPLVLGPIRQPPHYPDAAARQALLVQAVGLSQHLHACLTPYLPQLAVARRRPISRILDALVKVLADDIQIDGSGYPTERPKDEKGHYRIGSATDLDATFRQHDHDLTLGYNVAIATTGTRITAAVVRTGATPDNAAPADLLRQQLAAGRPLPPHMIMDRAGGWGKCRAQVDVVSQGQTVQVALIPTPGGADPNRFGPADFQVNAERTACTCPNGVVTTRLAPKRNADGLTARYLASDCRGCPFWTDCRGVDGKPKAQRSVFLTDHHAYLRQAAVFNQTPEGRALLARRWQVEPTVAWLTRYQGCRRARCLGQDAAQFQVFQACAMRNLLLWLSRCQRRRAITAA